ncbi:sensor histidine kinase [Gemmatimonas groenlandica]|uniref:histidine kinase n=1 Tax=Gemmatimonas groenlandica TaxID=2732249 RepID=A0A6M4INV7_9BACT|nr:HAMP domain-containing sensor histidine kinase [Gemmatimonas groenlandica]QJR36420.1 HAMP domain-containing histidine kinase [Gemmatimonas groenlandica]
MATSTNPVPDTDALVRFARRVSHDINNFSTVVRTYSELLLSDLPEGDPMHADVAEIHRAADATVRYLQRVTQFSRAGNMRRQPTSVDNGIIDAQALFATEQADRPVHVTLDGGEMQADASWWRDVLLELLRNAHDAAPAGRPIVVRSAMHDTGTIVDIEDEGDGIPDDLRASLTEPFVTSKHGVRGAGIGLAIVAAFVHALGGSIQFDRIDGADGTRTRVRVTLPA